jgi:hypothetical protein
VAEPLIRPHVLDDHGPPYPLISHNGDHGPEGSDRLRTAATVSGMFKKLLIIAVIVGVGFLAAKKMRAA